MIAYHRPERRARLRLITADGWVGITCAAVGLTLLGMSFAGLIR